MNGRDWLADKPDIRRLFEEIWLNHFKSPLDTLNPRWGITYPKVREYFFACDWNEVYDFIEFVASKYINDTTNAEFMAFCNEILGREVSAWRFVGGELTDITSQEEIDEIENALSSTQSGAVRNAHLHLKRSLELLSDKKNPDYRNSIKEAISAVEAISARIAGEPQPTLGKVLTKIEKSGTLPVHGALREAFSKLYGYTSDAEGIRHALMEEPNLSSEDARFMLIACSAFINYLVSKSSRFGISL